jgi:hypothetical protein
VTVAVQAEAGRRSAPRHVPQFLLRAAAQTVGRMNPLVDRQVRAALAMDTTDLSAQPAAIRETFPDIPNTTLEGLLAAR